MHNFSKMTFMIKVLIIRLEFGLNEWYNNKHNGMTTCTHAAFWIGHSINVDQALAHGPFLSSDQVLLFTLIYIAYFTSLENQQDNLDNGVCHT